MDLFKRVVLAFFCCQTRKFLNKVKYKIRKRDGELWDHSRQTGIHHCNQSHEQRATNELVIGCEGNETDLDNGEPFQSKSHQNLYPSTIVLLNAFYQQECASNLSNNWVGTFIPNPYMATLRENPGLKVKLFVDYM